MQDGSNDGFPTLKFQRNEILVRGLFYECLFSIYFVQEAGYLYLKQGEKHRSQNNQDKNSKKITLYI